MSAVPRALPLLLACAVAWGHLPGDGHDHGNTITVGLPSPRPATAGPFKFVFVADSPEARAQAERFVAFMRATPPFSRMGAQVAYEVADIDAEVLDCGNRTPRSPRIVNCNLKNAGTIGAQRGAHMTAAFTSRGSGGAGGSLPVASLDYPLNTQLHEMLHGFGFSDEYDYSDDEVALYCHPPLPAPNTASFAPRRNPFESDGQARTEHQGDIPWFGSIQASTLITTSGFLGTSPGIHGNELAALYRGGDCNRIVPTWKPFVGPTIMGSLQASTWIPPLYESHLLARMSAVSGQTIRLLPESGTAGADGRSSGRTVPPISPFAGFGRGSSSSTAAPAAER